MKKIEWKITRDILRTLKDGDAVTVLCLDGYDLDSQKNTAYAIRDIEVSDFHVKTATHSYYLFNTDNCRFLRSTVNGKPLPVRPAESLSRQMCDVW